MRLTLAVLLTCAGSAALAAPSPPFARYANPGIAPVNSWWIDTADGGTIVFDALRTFSDARVAVARLKARGRLVRAILLTHPHPDHVTGLAVFKQAFPDAPVYMPAGAVAYLSGDGLKLLQMNVKARARGDATDRIPAPDRELRGGETLTLGGTEVMATALGAGESPAAMAYWLPREGVLVGGDVVTYHREPMLGDGRVAAWLHQIEKLTSAFPAEATLLPGHGDPSPLGPAAAWQKRYLATYRDNVRAALRPGSPGGRCVTAAEAAAIDRRTETAAPTDGWVAKMPRSQLKQISLAGVLKVEGGAMCRARAG